MGLAAAGGHKRVVQVLLGAGAGAKAKMVDGSDPMSVARVNGEDDVVAELIALVEKTEGEAKIKAKAKFKNINKRAVNKNREKESLIREIRGQESAAPWYKVPGGRPPQPERDAMVSRIIL